MDLSNIFHLTYDKGLLWKKNRLSVYRCFLDFSINYCSRITSYIWHSKQKIDNTHPEVSNATVSFLMRPSKLLFSNIFLIELKLFPLWREGSDCVLLNARTEKAIFIVGQVCPRKKYIGVVNSRRNISLLRTWWFYFLRGLLCELLTEKYLDEESNFCFFVVGSTVRFRDTTWWK